MAPRTPRFQGRMGLTEPMRALRSARGVGGRRKGNQALVSDFGPDGPDGPSFARFRVCARARHPENGKEPFSRVGWKIEPVRPVRPKLTSNALKSLRPADKHVRKYRAQWRCFAPIGPKARQGEINMRGSDEREPQDVGI